MYEEEEAYVLRIHVACKVTIQRTVENVYEEEDAYMWRPGPRRY